MIETKDLELHTSLTIGTLTTNAASIKEFVTKQVENYRPELYVGKADEAKKDRAELNKAADALNAKRLEIEREFNKPFIEFKNIITDAVKEIKGASAQLDAIVKGEEAREKEEKRGKIAELWNAQQFDQVPLERVFNDKWLNKSYKMAVIESDIKSIISSIIDDLQVIDNFDAADVPLIKALYLDKLSIKEAAVYAEKLKVNRETLAREQAARQQHAINVQLEQQQEDEKAEAAGAEVEGLAAAAMQASAGMMSAPQQQQGPALESYALLFTGTREALTAVRQYMTQCGVTYTKLTDNKDGTFTM